MRVATAPVLLSDPRIARLPVRDDGAPLVDLAALGIACAARDQETGGVHRLVRAGLAERLVVAERFLPPGVRFHVVEGMRTAAVQRRLYAGYLAELRRLDPALGEDEAHVLTSRFVAPIGVAPHVAGAAVDLTLVDGDGRELDLGTAIDATPEESGGACYFDAPGLSATAREHRDLLAAVLLAAGLVNYPTEWWHWSYGDRYWAFVEGRDHALYGAVEPR